MIRQVSTAIPEMSKKKRGELKCKLESIEEKKDSSEVNISVMSKLEIEVPSTTQDQQPPLEYLKRI